MATNEMDYHSWTKSGLIEKVRALENELKNHRHTAPAASSLSSQPSSAEPQPPAGAATSADLPADPSSTEPQTQPSTPKKPKGKRKPDPSKYSTRYIALKLAYLGKNYGGFEFQAMGNQPSIEEELWKALTKACLVFPRDGKEEHVVDFDCCEYSKCGRTDRGVSAFGQVVGLRVRSNRPVEGLQKRAKVEVEAQTQTQADGSGDGPDGQGQPMEGVEVHKDAQRESEKKTERKPFDPIHDELQYPRLLNRILPPDIRILAWCPSPPPDFSARFSCRERQYRYFFTQPAFAPPVVSSSENQGNGAVSRHQGGASGWLDIEAMRDAARRFEGEHDFRNLCKIDAAKQITNFRREIFKSEIVEVEDAATALPYLNGAGPGNGISSPGQGPHPKVYSFNVNGSAFLWHQIRHMIAILFVVGQGLESPSLVTELLDVKTNPRKPNYTMADEVPLVLWDCIFPAEGDPERKDVLDWVYPSGEAQSGPNGLTDNLWSTWRERKMDELLANQLLRQVSQQHDQNNTDQDTEQSATGAAKMKAKASTSTKIYEGGNSGRNAGKYVPVMKKDKLESAEEQNEKYAKRKGYASSEDMRTKKGFRSAATEQADEEA